MKLLNFKLYIILLFFIIPLNIYGKEKILPKAQKGILDLTKFEFTDKGVIKTEGEWEFYWKQLLTPDDFRKTDSLPEKFYIKIPGPWSKLKKDGQNLPILGYGTYRLLIKVPAKNEQYIFKINDAYTNYRIYINNVFLGEVGKLDTSPQNSTPKFLMKEYPVYIDAGNDTSVKTIEIILQVSNYHHIKSGMCFTPVFGKTSAVINFIKDRYVLNMIIIGIILIISFNHLIHFLYRRNDRSNLYFGILCLVMILRNITTDDHILVYWIPQISWEWLIRLDNFSGFGTVAIFALFLYVLFNKDFPYSVLFVIAGLGLIISLIIFFTPILFFLKIKIIFELYVLVVSLYMIFGVLLPAFIRRRPGAFLAFIGYFVLTATAFNDILSNMGLIQSEFMAPYGLVFFMVIQSYLITTRSSKALNQNEKLSIELQNEKLNLEKRIQERTQELEQQNLELTKLRGDELLNNWFNQTYSELNDILNREKTSIENLSSKLLSNLVKHVKANVGVIYLYEEDDVASDEPYLKLIASYGVDKETAKATKIYKHEGLIGSCFASGTMKIIDDVPEGYIKVSSGLGQSKPRALIIVPLKLNEKVYGVIEIASLKRFSDKQVELIERISENYIFTINSLNINNRTSNLLAQYQQKELELRQKEQEMQQNLEELQSLREEIKRLKEKNK
jgi:putative methionine-R-sulfoxide reductase with GAF domain